MPVARSLDNCEAGWLLVGLFLLIAVVLAAVAPATGAAASCTIMGTAGPDVLHGTGGKDVICGGGGADVINGVGKNDRLVGGPGADTLNGGAGDDVLSGGPGDDRLNGGSGSNELIGGGGVNSCSGVGSSGSMQTCESPVAPVVPGAPGAPTAPPGQASVGSTQPEGENGGPIPPESSIPPCTEVPCLEGEPEPDREPPYVLMADFESPFVGLTDGPGTVRLFASAWDDSSGVASIAATIDGPDGFWKEVELSPAGREGLYEATVPVAPGTPSGVYRLASMHLADNSGRSETIGQANISDGRIHDRHFTVYDGIDDEPPAISDFSISPGYADTASGPATVTFEADLEDSKSGIRDMEVLYELPGNPLGSWELTDWAVGDVEANEDPYHARAVATLPLPEYAPAGVYRIHKVILRDLAGNWTPIEGDALRTLGPTTFETPGPSDSTPPEIVGFSVSPTVVPAEGGKVVSYVHIRDDLTGLTEFPENGWSQIDVGFRPPWRLGVNSGFGSSAPELVSGTAQDGIWRVVDEVPAEDIPGDYQISLEATDRAFNKVRLDSSELEAMGWSTVVTKLP